MKIYVIIGHSGTHDNYQTWMVKGFYDKDLAEDLIINCKAEAHRIHQEILAYEKKCGLDTNSHYVAYTELNVGPVKYWEDYNEITTSNNIDDHFQYDKEYVDYTIDELEVE